MLKVSPICDIRFTSRPMSDAVNISRVLDLNGYNKSEKDYYRFIDSEINELREARSKNDKDNMEEEVGDVLFDTIMLADYYGVNPVSALNRTNTKIMNRIKIARQIAGKPLTEFTFPERLEFWDIAKKRLRKLDLEA